MTLYTALGALIVPQPTLLKENLTFLLLADNYMLSNKHGNLNVRCGLSGLDYLFTESLFF